MYTIRLARVTDKADLASFTQNTFQWGDYITDRFDEWLTSSDGHLLVAEYDGHAVAVTRGVLLSPSEMWLQGARVHPDHRGHGLSSQLAQRMFAWGHERGGEVVRVFIEDWNQAPQRLVTNDGYRRVSRWLFARRQIINRDPQPTGNGGQRVPGDERLRPAPSAEAEAAYMAWSTSDMARTARGLMTDRWTWRQLTVDDLRDAAPDGRFLEGATGWALADRDRAALNVTWMMSSAEDTYRLVRALLDRAIETAATELRIWVPATRPLETALTRIGCELEPGSIWERALI